MEKSSKEAIGVIYEQCVSDNGFVRNLRMGAIDESGFDSLIAAIKELELLT
jgi:hypothetical protein